MNKKATRRGLLRIIGAGSAVIAGLTKLFPEFALAARPGPIPITPIVPPSPDDDPLNAPFAADDFKNSLETISKSQDFLEAIDELRSEGLDMQIADFKYLGKLSGLPAEETSGYRTIQIVKDQTSEKEHRLTYLTCLVDLSTLSVISVQITRQTLDQDFLRTWHAIKHNGERREESVEVALSKVPENGSIVENGIVIKSQTIDIQKGK